MQRCDERAARAAAERARTRAVDEVEDELRFRGVVGAREAALLERRAELGDEGAERAFRRLSDDRVRHEIERRGRPGART